MPTSDHIRSSDHTSREWLIDAHGCDSRRLADAVLLGKLLGRIVADLGLQPVAPPMWHKFAPPGGVTGMYLLSESHLTCHTWPEYGLATINLFCCRPRPDWPWEEQLRECLGARRVAIRIVERGGGEP